MAENNRRKDISILGAFALSVGTSIGWGSFVVTSSNYLSRAGLLGSIIGIALGFLLMSIIAYNYHHMINQTPDSGGIYSFVKHTFNGDHAFLASWALIIVYLGILWANVTSIALFSKRYTIPLHAPGESSPNSPTGQPWKGMNPPPGKALENQSKRV